VYAVFPDPDHALESALCPAVLEVAVSGRGGTQGKHAIEDLLIVETHDQYRQVLPQSPQIDRKIRHQRGLSDAPLVGRDRENRRTGRRVGGAFLHGTKCTHRVGWKP